MNLMNDHGSCWWYGACEQDNNENLDDKNNDVEFDKSDEAGLWSQIGQRDDDDNHDSDDGENDDNLDNPT